MIGDRIPSSEITPEHLYNDRRMFIKAGLTAATVGLTGWGYRHWNRAGGMDVNTEQLSGVTSVTPDGLANGFTLSEPQTPLQSIVNYNNFYEFTTDKEAVAGTAKDFVSKPWQITIDGMVQKPRTIDLDDLMKLGALEERIYRMRCVEAWSMVIPWVGIPLSKVLDLVEPMGSAKYIAFETLNDPSRMPGQKTMVLEWPYVEGLRIDEARHPLAILAVGLYGRMLPPQNGAPVRLVVPWKYGFKGIKSIVRITFSETQPPTSWSREGPREYGFFANVNPEVPHPRWSQATEQRLGESGRRPTLMFNGYSEQVASLYAGMDLRANY